MKISVALCTFDGESFLPEQLASIASQTRLPDEIVICDDGSSDSTTTVAELFQASVPASVVIHRNPSRLGFTRNFEKALGLCSGDAIVLADQDDVWHARKVEVCAAELERTHCTFTDARRIDAGGNALPGGTLWDHIGFTARQRRAVRSGRGMTVLVERNVATGATMAFRRELLARALPVPAAPGMHHDMWIALVAAAVGGLTCIDEPLIDYREHERQQLGAGEPVGGVVRWVDAARQTTAADYALKASHLQLLQERVPEAGLGGRIAHLLTRAGMTGARPSRLPAVLRELVSLRYHRYSNGLFSAGKDLVW